MSNQKQIEESKEIEREEDTPLLKGTEEPNSVKEGAETGSVKVLTELPTGNQEDLLETI
jgi:hypothetical protein